MAHDLSPEWLAGGTDVLERRRSGVSRGPLRKLPDDPRLGAIIWRSDGGVTLGAGLTIDAIASDAKIAAAYPGLAAAAGDLATPEIRRMATLGGNIAQRTRCWYYRNDKIACLKKGGTTCPARNGNHLYGVAFDTGACVAPHPSTLAAALLAYDARITTNTRAAATVDEILGDGGNRDNQLSPDEWIAAVTLPPPPPHRATYRRAIGRAAAEWPLAELVACIGIDGDRVATARLAVGGVAPVPRRLLAAEAALVGTSAAAPPVAEIQRLAVDGAKPLAMTAYKLRLLEGLIADALGTLCASAT